jgi:Ca-activated chloride channel family protein
LLKQLEGLEVQDNLRAGTDIGYAISAAIIHLDSTAGAKRKVIILLSDGQQTLSNDEIPTPRKAAQLAANLKYAIYTIDSGGDLPPTADPKALTEREVGRQTLRDVAEMTGGKAFTATDGVGMLAAYKEIDTLERAPIETYQYRRYFEYYPWCAGLAVVLILAAHLLDRTRWRVVP